jgi:hypothetical protein
MPRRSLTPAISASVPNSPDELLSTSMTWELLNLNWEAEISFKAEMTAASLARAFPPRRFGTAIEARIAMIAITMRSSTSVNPRARRAGFFLR